MNEPRRRWWIDDPPGSWRACIVSAFNAKSKKHDVMRVEVIEVLPDDPADLDDLLRTIDIEAEGLDRMSKLSCIPDTERMYLNNIAVRLRKALEPKQ